MTIAQTRKPNFFLEHSLSIGSSALLVLWICLYIVSDPNTHWGSFFGNAIADWSGMVVMVFATKYMYEKDSPGTRPVAPKPLPRPLEWMREHSITTFLLVTGVFWVVLFMRMNPNAKWGQVVGNIVSEWTQSLGAVLLTRHMIARHHHQHEIQKSPLAAAQPT
jgi:hypothetical protein